MFKAHGGNLAEIEEIYGIPAREILDFSVSVNPAGLPDPARQAYGGAYEEIGAYPDPFCRRLVRQASLRFGHPPEEILAGNGSTEFIFLIPRVLDCAAVHLFGPTYSDYAEAARMAGKPAIFHDVGLSPGTDDLDSVLKSLEGEANLVFLCNPNNPTGRYFPGERLRELIVAYASILFVVDEAYADFVREDQATLLGRSLPGNLIVLRSLTKSYSLPGLRIGLVFGPEKLILRLEAGREPWTVNHPAQRTGEILLREKEYLETSRKMIQSGRAELSRLISAIPDLHPLSSEVNFLLVRIAGGWTADDLKKDLIPDKILIRSCQGTPGLGPDYFRVGVRKSGDHARLASALRRRFA